MRRMQKLWLQLQYNIDLGTYKHAMREIFRANAARPFRMDRVNQALGFKKLAERSIERIGGKLGYDSKRVDSDFARVNKEAAPTVFR